MTTSVRNNCVLVKVSIGKQSAYMTDKSLTKEIEDRFSTSGRGKVVKRLFKDNKSFAAVQAAYNKVYTEYTKNSLPWNEAFRVIKASEFTKFVNEIDDLASKAKAVLDKFVENYNDHVLNDQVASNGMTKMEDYPSKDELAESFYVKWSFSNIPDAEDFRVIEGLDPQEVDALVQKAVEAEKENMQVPVKESWNRLYKVTSHLKERLNEYKGTEGERLHKSLLTNVQECVDVLRRLNITEDSNLTAVMDELESNVLSSTQIDRLKIIEDERKETVSKVDDILNKMSVFSAKE